MNQGISGVRKVVIVDAHVHLELPVPYVLSDLSGMAISPEALIDSMERYGIDKSVLMGSSTSAQVSLETQEENHRLIVEASRKYSKKIIPFAFINPRSGKAGLELAKKCFSEYGMKGLKIWPWADFPINCKAVYDLAEICREYRVPLSVHTDNLDPRAHPWLIGEVAKDFPDLTVIAAHMSAEVSLDSIIVAKNYDNVILEASPAPPCHAIEKAVEVIGDSRITWGTDWPFWDQRLPLARIRSLRIPEKSKEKILGENILRILRMEE